MCIHLTIPGSSQPCQGCGGKPYIYMNRHSHNNTQEFDMTQIGMFHLSNVHILGFNIDSRSIIYMLSLQYPRNTGALQKLFTLTLTLYLLLQLY